MSRYAVLILAAGSSSRLGRPKQQLPFRGSTLLAHTIREAVSLSEAITFVVINNNMQPGPGEGYEVIINEQASEGMASSIRAGLNRVHRAYPPIDGCLIIACDQPFVNTGLLARIIRTHINTGKGIVAASYGDIQGIPVLFDQKYFGALLQLQGDKGAKSLLLRHQEDVATVPFPEGLTDIDTEEDYRQLAAAEKNKRRK